jgi:ATP-dependent 26S proteasome regulatory subunit
MAITNTIIKNITNIQKSDLDIIILAALVKKNIIDPKLLKYDLFPKQIFFSSMKDEERKNLFTLVFKDSSNDIVQFSPDINMDELIKKTNGFSPEYIKKLVAVAIEDATYALFSDQKKKSVPVIVTQKHLLKNIELLKEESKTK